MILSCSRRVADLAVPAAPCFDRKSFLVIMAGRAVTAARCDDGRELSSPLAGRFSAERDREEVKARRGRGPKGGGYASEARKPPNRACLAR